MSLVSTTQNNIVIPKDDVRNLSMGENKEGMLYNQRRRESISKKRAYQQKQVSWGQADKGQGGFRIRKTQPGLAKKRNQRPKARAAKKDEQKNPARNAPVGCGMTVRWTGGAFPG